MDFTPHAYQRRAIDFAVAHPRCLLFLDMGLGKSVITLTAFQTLRFFGEADRLLVIAPKKVAESTWSTEAAKWTHLAGMRVAVAVGPEKARAKALEQEADVYVTTRDNCEWLEKWAEANRWPKPDMVALDELTSFKNHASKRFKAMRRFLDSVPRVLGLTGTPTPNGLLDLWAQVYLIDKGRRLGRYVTHYRERWFDSVVRNNIAIKTWPKVGAEEEIRGLLSDITLAMRAEDWLELPPLIIEDTAVLLGPKTMADYRRFERDRVAEVVDAAGGNPDTVTASSAAALAVKLSQWANGFVYNGDGAAYPVHTEKLAALREIVESAGSPVLVFYAFREDERAILSGLKDFGARSYRGPEDLADWNAGRIRVLLAHPASTAYGLNMQQGGHTAVWYSTGYNLELYLQANARLHRQGQRHRVKVFNLIAAGTVDERMAAVVRGKDISQKEFFKSLVKP